jgi:hypothetical protein
MSRKGEGNQWQQPGFSVFMHTEEYTPPPCQSCVNNKYHGGAVEICEPCVKYKNFKAKGKK